jgi:hypothetical protein
MKKGGGTEKDYVLNKLKREISQEAVQKDLIQQLTSPMSTR